jgi:DnaJ-class molecular chaperone
MAAREDTRDEKICHPCRGRGSVISGLGGEQRTTTCPWCGGSGERDPSRDAQEAGEALRAAAG